MPTALAGSHGAKAYGASSGVVGAENFWDVTMARSHGSAVPLPLSIGKQNKTYVFMALSTLTAQCLTKLIPTIGSSSDLISTVIIRNDMNRWMMGKELILTATKTLLSDFFLLIATLTVMEVYMFFHLINGIHFVFNHDDKDYMTSKEIVRSKPTTINKPLSNEDVKLVVDASHEHMSFSDILQLDGVIFRVLHILKKDSSLPEVELITE
ncbi:hypothetical protein Tco_0477378 [Tanacetum coccineum]